MAATPQLRDRLSFLHRLPILLKGTSDDDVPCPGYLFEEIAKISHESLGSSQCLLEYLLNRLHSGSGRVKLKEAAVFSGPPDPLHGNSLYQKVRAAAQDLGSALFSDSLLPPPPSQPPRALPPAGMGSESRPQGALQGFGYSKDRGPTGSAGEAFLSTIQKAAEVVANAVRPGLESPSTCRPLPRGDAYQPAMTPAASHGVPGVGGPLPGALPGARGSGETPLRPGCPGKGCMGRVRGLRISPTVLFVTVTRPQPGQAGGGWDEPDSGSSSQNSSRESGDPGKVSDSGSRSGSDSPSAASQAPSDLAERVEAVTLSDCQQEQSLVQMVTRGPRAFLSREEAQCFIKECGLLNCEVVLELLTRCLAGTSECVQMRALGAIASLGCTDLLSQEHILLLTRPWLQELSAGSPGPVTNKATKILRHFEASCRQRPPARRPPAKLGPVAAHGGPADLLSDTEAAPFSGSHAFLQPLSSTLLPAQGLAQPRPLDGSPLSVSREAGAGPEWDPLGTGSPKGAPKHCPGPGGCRSLFAGMELVACPRLLGAGPATEEALQAPWTSSQRAAAAGASPGSEPSAFPFLNS
ncbi:AP-4 complex accessory subunit tepsin isoform X2 [Suricata suricatta]|uniref:AP-4 complex accessory subunit tepsin isoform X2 n=1 Tax=Suricata suricatta TaxID=37032 RepID=UPI00115540E0|nr:AP-4 complex accessory subunit tepsin isoform X2 [Suricata suricatta]